MQAILDKINAKNQERDLLLKTLEMWHQVTLQGINPDDVDRFTFDYTLMSGIELSKQRRISQRLYLPFSNSNPFGWPIEYNEAGSRVIRSKKFNVVIMKNGDRVKLNPIIDAPR